MSISEIIPSAEPNSLIVVYGPMGIMLGWFMWRGEKLVAKISDLAHRMDGLTKALLVDMVEKNHISDATKKYANETISKIDARSRKAKSE